MLELCRNRTESGTIVLSCETKYLQKNVMWSQVGGLPATARQKLYASRCAYRK